MSFFSKTLDKLKGALRKTAEVLNTDVRTLFVPGRQINDAFLTETEEKLLQSDMGVKSVDRIITEIRDRWRLGKIRNGDEAGRLSPPKSDPPLPLLRRGRSKRWTLPATSFSAALG